MKVIVDKCADVHTFNDVAKIKWSSANYLELHYDNGDMRLIPHGDIDGVMVEDARG